MQTFIVPTDYYFRLLTFYCGEKQKNTNTDTRQLMYYFIANNIHFNITSLNLMTRLEALDASAVPHSDSLLKMFANRSLFDQQEYTCIFKNHLNSDLNLTRSKIIAPSSSTHLPQIIGSIALIRPCLTLQLKS